MSDASVLIDNLSNFYKTYSYNEEFIPGLFQSYIETITLLEDYVKQIETNINSSECETFRLIPYASTETNMWEYSIQDLIISSKFPYYKDITNASLLWSLMTPDSRVEILEDLGRYTIIETSIGVNNTNAKIIFFKLYSSDDEIFTDGIDYKLINNKIYPINQNISMPNNKIILRDMIVDYDYTYKRTGIFLNKEYSGVVSKQEYRDTNLAFMEAAGKGPEIVNLNKSLMGMFEDSNFSFVDVGTKDLRKKFLWESGSISPFDFIVNIPSTYSEPVKRVDLFSEYIKIVKPSDTDYLMNWTTEKTDVIPFIETIVMGKSGLAVTDNPIDKDTIDATLVISEDNIILFGELNSLDSIQYASMDFDNIYYDIYNKSNIKDDTYYDYAEIYSDDDIAFDDAYPEYATYDDMISAPMIKYKTFPEYPLSFSVTTGAGYAIISFKNNSVGCTGYRVFRDDVEHIDIIPEDIGLGERIVLNDTVSGQHSYEIKAYYKPFTTSDERLEYSISPKVITVTV